MEALEKASVNEDITDFTLFLVSLVKTNMNDEYETLDK